MRLVRRRSLIVVLLAAMLLASCGTRQDRDTGPAALLFYARDGAIYVCDHSGTPRKLTSGPGDTQPAPSPDGKRVAYVHRTAADEPGGELRVFDLESGQSRRLVDPAALVPTFEDERPGVEYPRWSPTGDRIAFLKATFGGGGFLLTAAADSGVVLAPDKPLFADPGYSWSPDGTRIAWVAGRSDVRPVDVGVLTVGGLSTAVATDTNAVSVSFDRDGRSILFSNGDATGDLFASIPFALRKGGIYAVDPSASPALLFGGTAFYSDVQALKTGEIGFTESDEKARTKTIRVLGSDRAPRTVAPTAFDAPPPAWADDGSLAYVGDSAERPLLVKADGDPQRIDRGVEAFDWSG